MKKIFMLLAVSALMLTGCNNGDTADNNAVESKTTVSQNTEETDDTAATTEVPSSETTAQTTGKKSGGETTTTAVSKQTEATTQKEKKQTERSTEAVSPSQKTSEVKTSQQSGSQSEQEYIPEKDRTNNEGDLIYEPEEVTDEPEATDNTTEEFRIVTEAPIELPFIPAG